MENVFFQYTGTGDTTKNMGANNPFLICSEEMVNRPRNATNESSKTLTRNAKKTKRRK